MATENAPPMAGSSPPRRVDMRVAWALAIGGPVALFAADSWPGDPLVIYAPAVATAILGAVAWIVILDAIRSGLPVRGKLLLISLVPLLAFGATISAIAANLPV